MCLLQSSAFVLTYCFLQYAKALKKEKNKKSSALLEERKFCTLIILQMLNCE